MSELSEEIRAARTDITRPGTRVADNADLLAHLLPRVAGLDTVVSELDARLDALDETSSALKGKAGAAALYWRPDRRPSRHRVGKPSASGSRPCWARSTRSPAPRCPTAGRCTPAVIELVWLRRTYTAAHTPDAAINAAAEWHIHWRRDALANIAAGIPKR